MATVVNWARSAPLGLQVCPVRGQLTVTELLYVAPFLWDSHNSHNSPASWACVVQVCPVRWQGRPRDVL